MTTVSPSRCRPSRLRRKFPNSFGKIHKSFTHKQASTCNNTGTRLLFVCDTGALRTSRENEVNNTPVTAAYFRALNERNITMFMACFTGECEAHSPFGETPYRGRANLSKMFSQRTNGWHRLRVIPKSASRSGNRIAVMWMADGTTKSGHCSCFEGVSVFEIDDMGKITRLEEYWDARSVMKQIDPLGLA
jgi:hypothetical protein